MFIILIIYVRILVSFIIMLNTMARKHVSFPKRVFTALGIGIALGIILHLIYGTQSNVLKQSTDWFSIVGDGYAALLQMIVMPLIFISIVATFSKIQIGEKFAKIVSFIFHVFNRNRYRSDCSYSWYHLCINIWFRCFIYRSR